MEELVGKSFLEFNVKVVSIEASVGGIAMLWISKEFKGLVEYQNKNYLTMRLQGGEKDKYFWLSNIYRPIINSDKILV